MLIKFLSFLQVILILNRVIYFSMLRLIKILDELGFSLIIWVAYHPTEIGILIFLLRLDIFKLLLVVCDKFRDDLHVEFQGNEEHLIYFPLLNQYSLAVAFSHLYYHCISLNLVSLFFQIA